MKFSFVIGTLERCTELKYCLESLLEQTYGDYEIIVIDQSRGAETEEMIGRLVSERIRYRHADYKGLSKARNEALVEASGDYICLTDDDARYEQDYLEKLKAHFDKNPDMIISGYMWNAVNGCDFVAYSKVQEGKPLSARQIIRYCPSPAICIPRKAFEDVGVFDENFGVGAHFGAAEETDFLLRARRRGWKVYHFKDVKAVHPHEHAQASVDSSAVARKAYSYPYGTGAMFKKHFQSAPLEMLGPFSEQLIKDFVKVVLGREHSRTVLGRFVEGCRKYGR